MVPVAMRPVLSVTLAVAGAHALHLEDTWWAAISAYTVMQADFRSSVQRGLHRVIGTVAGAALGIALGLNVTGKPAVFVMVLALATWAGLFAALVSRYGYSCVLALATFSMVVSEALSAQAGLEAFALERVANVMVGTLACVVVSGLTTWGPRSTPRQAPSGATDRREVAWHALQGAAAVAILSALGALNDLKVFSQAMVTTIAVLIVPAAPAGGGVTASILQRMLQRLGGCFIAGVLALSLLPLLAGRALWCQLTLVLGIWAGAWLQRHAVRFSYAATQFSVALLMVFVQDRGWTLDVEPTLHRLAGMLAGVAVLSMVLLFPRRRGSTP